MEQSYKGYLKTTLPCIRTNHSILISDTMSDDNKAAALKVKEEGNTAYKKRDFTTAIAKYQEAWELHKDITFLNNLAGMSSCAAK